MKTVLVSGVNGFVGQHLAKELSENGLSVVGIGGKNIDTSRPDHLDDYKVLDLLDPEQVKTIDFAGIDGVIHLAGMAAVGPSFERPMEYININMGIEVNLFEAALVQKASPRFLIISSGTLYNPAASLPLTETSPVLPNSPYAISKLGQEQLSNYYVSRGFECVIARPFNHIGPGQNLGFIVPDLASQIVNIKKGQAQEVLVGNLDSKRDYTDVRDIVRAYRLMLMKGKSGETYNICSGKAISGHEILDELVAAAGVSPTIKTDPDKLRPSDYPQIYGSYDKLAHDVGWQPQIDLKQTLADVIADWQAR